jgi:ABC-type glycerol-3-phosphate transport system substrate-binding protein
MTKILAVLVALAVAAPAVAATSDSSNSSVDQKVSQTYHTSFPGTNSQSGN